MRRGESFRRPSQADLLNGQINWKSEGERERGREGEQIELSASTPPGRKKSADPDQNASKAACCAGEGLATVWLDGLFAGKTTELITERVVMVAVVGFDRESRL